MAALLVDAGRPVPLDTLIERVWDASPPETARDVVYAHVARIRKVLAQANAADGGTLSLDRQPDGYLLRAGADQIDLHRFRQLVARAPGETGPPEEVALLLREAIGLRRGTPLDGLGGGWAARAREGIERQWLSAVIRWARAELRMGRHQPVAEELPEIIDRHPMAEALVAEAMRAFQAGGRTAEALDLYARTRALLTDRLGTEPSAPLRDLHQMILRGEGRPAAAVEPADTHIVPAQLPADVSSFTGRLSQLRRLDALSFGSGPASAVVVTLISGMAGVGKTALAVHWARRVRNRFPDGQLWVNLRGHAPGEPLSPAEVLTRFLHALGVPAEQVPVDLDEMAALYRSLLAGRRALIVLDNARSAEQVRPMLPGDPGCVVVITSRDRLRGLIAHDGAHSVDLPELSSDESVELLTRLLGADRVASEPAAVARLAHACGHLPLALRIVVTRLAEQPSLGISDHLTELDGANIDRLAALAVDGDEQTAIRAAFALSYRALPAPARRMFRLLGLVPLPEITVEAAAALADGPHDEAATLLSRLAATHLVTAQAPGRYAMHDLLRLYATERTHAEDDDEARSAARDRVIGWYRDTADIAARVLYGEMVRMPAPATGGTPHRFADHRAALAWLDTEWANLLAAIRYAAVHGPRSAAWLITDALRGYFWQRHLCLDWMTAARAGLDAATRAGDALAMAAMRFHLGSAHTSMGDYPQAVEDLSAAAELADGTGWPEGQASILGHLGSAHTDMGDLHEAASYHSEALAMFRRAGRASSEAITLANLGQVYAQLGRLELAADQLFQSLNLYKEFGSPDGEAHARANLGEVEHTLGRFGDARENLQAALTAFRDIGNRYAEAETMNGLAAVHRDSGRPVDGLELAGAALTLAREIGERRSEADILNTLGTLHLRERDAQRSADRHAQALEIAREIGAHYPEAEALIGLAAADERLGRLDDALDKARDALSLARRSGYRVLEGRAATGCATALLTQGDHCRAAELAESAVEIHGTTGHRAGLADALTALGHARRGGEDLRSARECWRRALAVLAGLGMPDTHGLHELVAEGR